MWWNIGVKAAVRLLGRRCWQLAMKRQKKDVWKLTKKKREKLKGAYIRAERAEVEVRLGKLKKRMAAGKDEITGEMIKGEGDRVVDWIWR